MKKLINYFKREILPFIMMVLIGSALVLLIIFLIWLDKVRFFY